MQHVKRYHTAVTVSCTWTLATELSDGGQPAPDLAPPHPSSTCTSTCKHVCTCNTYMYTYQQAKNACDDAKAACAVGLLHIIKYMYTTIWGVAVSCIDRLITKNRSNYCLHRDLKITANIKKILFGFNVTQH